MTCNCNRNGDVEYTIVLNQQGPQGRQGNAGQNGFSPIITVQSSTEANYQLKIISADGEIVTPNLKGQTPTLPSGTANLNSNNVWTGTNAFRNTVTVNGNQVITEPEFDELANDVVDINSALGGLSFKKYTEAEYESIARPDANTIYYVTSPDGNTFKVYLGDLELPQSEGGSGGGITFSTASIQSDLKITNIDTEVIVERYVIPLTGELEINTGTRNITTKSGTFLTTAGTASNFTFQYDGSGVLELVTYLTGKTPNTLHYIMGGGGNWRWTVYASETDTTSSYLYMGKAMSDSSGTIDLNNLIPAADNIRIIST